MSSFLAYCINTVGYLRLVTISDLVDIAILTFLFYKLIGLFRRCCSSWWPCGWLTSLTSTPSTSC